MILEYIQLQWKACEKLRRPSHPLNTRLYPIQHMTESTETFRRRRRVKKLQGSPI
jgi:hypothetical protein